MDKQVDKNVYEFQRYCDLERWSSYWQQIKEVLEHNPDNILEIGIGDNVFGNYIKNNTSIDYKSLDIAEDLNPDFISNIDNIPINDNCFDVVCVFEVLEHLSFEKFVECLTEIKRVSRQYVIISLPHWGRHFSVEVRMPFFKKIRWQYKFNLLPIEHIFDGQHYWEIGKKGYPLNLIKKKINDSGFKIKKDFICFDSPYHHFFVLEK